MGMITEMIDAVLYAAQDQEPRRHMGCSSIGEECGRKIWYSFRWVTKTMHKPSLLRLFERGHLEEDRFVNYLKLIGIKVYQYDKATGKQYRFKGYKGHAGGEIDGVGDGVIGADPFLLEFKTHNEKSFKDLVANGVEMSKPVHYVQMQMYMGAFQLRHALYMAVDKNSDNLYDEIVPFNEAVYEKYNARMQALIDAPEPPPRISNNPTWYECKWCEHYQVCHMKAAPLRNCRTCAHSTPIEDGRWVCENTDSDMGTLTSVIPIRLEKSGCDTYHAHPME